MKDLRDAIVFHQLVLNAEGRSERTQKQYLFYEKKYLEYLEVRHIPPTLDALTLDTMRQAVLWYRNQPDKHRTRGGEVAARAFVDILKRLAKLLEEEGVVMDSPLRRMKRVSITKHSREPFSKVEVNALWAACKRTQHPIRDEALLLLLVDTGMRIGEACGLTVDKLDLEGRIVRVLGKGKRERAIPFGTAERRDGGLTARALRVYLDHRPESVRGGKHFFLARDGYPLTATGGNDLLHRLGKLAGVDNSHPHRLRHTFCTEYLTTYPGDELGLRRIVGHLSKNVLSDYVHLSQTAIAERAGRASIAESWIRR